MSQYDWATALTLWCVVIGSISSAMNATAFLVFLRNKMLHSATNLLNAFLGVVDLCLAALISLTISLTLNLQEYMCGRRTLLNFLSAMCLYFMTMSPVVSVVISVYRYRTTVNIKNNKLLHMKSASIPIAVSFVVPFITVILPLLDWGYFPLQYICPSDYITDITESDEFFTIYLIQSILVIPLVIMIFSYYKIYKAINFHQDTCNCQKQHNVSKTNRSVRLMKCIVCSFLCIWGLYFIILSVSVFSLDSPALAVTLIHFLVGISTIINSVLYVLMNKLYRKCTLRLIQCRGEYVRSYASRMLGSNMLLDGQKRANHVLVQQVVNEHENDNQKNIDFLPMKSLGHDDSGVGADEIEESVLNESRDDVPPLQSVQSKNATMKLLHEKHESARRLSIMFGHLSSDDEAYDEFLDSQQSQRVPLGVISGNIDEDHTPLDTTPRKRSKGSKKKRKRKQRGTLESWKRTNKIYSGAVHPSSSNRADVTKQKQLVGKNIIKGKATLNHVRTKKTSLPNRDKNDNPPDIISE